MGQPRNPECVRCVVPDAARSVGSKVTAGGRSQRPSGRTLAGERREQFRRWRQPEDDRFIRRFQLFERVAQRELAQLDAAATLDFLRVPPGNRLKALKGDRKGY